MQKVLIIEDEAMIAKMIADQFIKSGFQSMIEYDGISGYQAFEMNDPDLIVLDLMLPYMDGYSVCRKIRKKSNVPVIMLTARTNIDDQLMGYEAKVDDYMIKPFHPEVLVAKAKALLNLASHRANNQDTIEYNGLMLDPYARKVQLDGADVILEPKQFEILLQLMQNKNIVLSREQLLNAIWGYDFFGSERVIDSHIKKLRKQLLYKAYMIVTVSGSGYRFEVNSR
ncbi:MAG: response regulator transcription factor [Candidatus Limiplasma sp.]|nr:response regulator transcription factor [Candidatus Limiplasma sp.]